MKPKYFLENYDKILKDIKNPRIIFNSDLTPFLENDSFDSFLIYQIKFIQQNGKTKYVVKKPIHNLHPKVKKFNYSESEASSELEHYIPKILNELNIPEKQVSWRWCSKKRNTLYILKNCEMEDLTQENRFFLYCYHSLKKENNKIKKLNKERIFKLKTKTKIEQYIHRKQLALENLEKRLTKEINPVKPSNLYQFSHNYDKTDCLKITYIYLEKLHRFIEKEYRNYLNESIRIPFRTTFFKEFELTKKLKEVKSSLLDSNLNDQLLQLINKTILKVETISIKEKLTYYEFNYCSEFITILYKQIKSETITIETITECLFDLNYNSLKFFKYLTADIKEELELQENNIQKIEILYRMLKTYNQMNCRNLIKYKVNLPTIKKQIVNWIGEEIDYLNRKIKLETNQYTTVMATLEDKPKLLCDFSVAQLSCFFGIMEKIGMIKPKNHTEVFRFIADNLKTINTDKISIDSIKAKYYNVESHTEMVVRDKLLELVRLTNN